MIRLRAASQRASNIEIDAKIQNLYSEQLRGELGILGNVQSFCIHAS